MAPYGSIGAMKNKLSPSLCRSLATGLASMFILPTPRVTIWFYRWWIAQLRVSDGSMVEFRGTVGQIWLPLVILPVQAYFFYVIISWFTQNVHPSSGTALSFHGSWHGRGATTAGSMSHGVPLD